MASMHSRRSRSTALRRPQAEIDLIKHGLKQAIAISEGKSREMAKKTHIVGSSNVFADLGRPRPAEALVKAELARRIAAIIGRRALTQAAAAAILQVDQPKVSALIRRRLAGFSLDRLVRFLVLLGSDVEIVVRSRPRASSAARVMVV